MLIEYQFDMGLSIQENKFTLQLFPYYIENLIFHFHSIIANLILVLTRILLRVPGVLITSVYRNTDRIRRRKAYISCTESRKVIVMLFMEYFRTESSLAEPYFRELTIRISI